MPIGEFDLIQRWFMRPAKRSPLGVGDDCALLQPAPGMQLAVSTDTLVEGRHFLSTVAPERLGHKALAVNLSDLAACGATPLAFTLALTMPRIDEAFLDGFARGLFALADAQGIEVVGGDTTAGPLNICIAVFGEVPAGQALLRSGARVGDELWVSGSLGDARLALEVFRGTVTLDGAAFEAVRARMELPTPRVALGIALRGEHRAHRPAPCTRALRRRRDDRRRCAADERGARRAATRAAARMRAGRGRRLRAAVHRAGGA
jgi:thiamine-monophosphate kinase